MSTPVHDLSKLTIRRDQPPPQVSGALRLSIIITAVAAALVAGTVIMLKNGNVPVVQTVVASASSAGGAGGAATGVTANGYVVARTKASVAAKVSGRLAFLGVTEGSFVRVGEIIARLENADYLASVSQAEANVQAARATLLEAQADRDQTRREAQRARDVRAQNAQLVSQQELESAESRAAQADARAGAAEARVGVADAGLRLAQVNLENAVIRAPFTGTVLRKEAEVGEMVAPSVGGGLTRGAVVTMADLTSLEVEVDVNEAYIARIRNGADTRITLDAYPDTSFRGRVRQVVPTADRQRATVQVKVAITDRDPRILPEMGARVDFLEPEAPRAADAPAAPPVVRVPSTAVRDIGGRSTVFIVREGRLLAREVTAGPVSGGQREIRRGLTGGELLLSGGLENPVDGMKVKTTP